MKKILLYSAALLTIASISFISCKKSGADRSSRLQIYLTDAPGDFEAVNIDVKDIMINVTGDTVNGWQSLSGVNSGVYDLLKLRNDDDTLLADAEIPSGRIHQLRLVLGTGNTVKVEGVSEFISLETPSAQQSGLKLNIQQDVTGGVLYKIILDFDAARSIVKTGNNRYMLKPVIRTVLSAIGGSIKGIVMPKTFQSKVYAVQGIDTITSTFTGTDGGYLLKGLAAGNYDVFYKSGDIVNYRDSLRTNISVTTNMITQIDTTFLRHQ
jgi:hypothetical protein